MGAFVVLSCLEAAAAKPVFLAQRRLSRQARAAYDKAGFSACAALYFQAGEGYSAACCEARAGHADEAFAALERDAAKGQTKASDIEADADLATLRGDSRFPKLVAKFGASYEARAATLNRELLELYEQDQAERQQQTPGPGLTEHDAERRARGAQLVAEGRAKVSDDYFHAAMLMQHGETSADFQQARDWAMKAVELDAHNDLARWLVAAATDRKLMTEKKPQLYGTQYSGDASTGGMMKLWKVDPKVTDAERARWNVPSLREAKEREAQMRR